MNPEPGFSSVLAHRALDKAAIDVVDHVKRCLADNERILITGDPDLASSDGAYHQVQNGYDRLLVAADKLLSAAGDDDSGQLATDAASTLAPDTLASALPSVTALVSPLRATSNYATTVDTTAAIGLVASLLTGAGRTVQIDEFRLVPQGRIARLDKRLQEQRSALSLARIDFEQQRLQAEARRVEASGRVNQVKEEMANATADAGDPHELETDLEDEIEERDQAAGEARRAAVMVGVTSELVSTIDVFTTAVHAVAPTGNRSPFVDAALREQLHGPKAGLPTARRFGKVLLIQAVSASADQLFNDPRGKDRFHALGSLSLSYYLLDVESGNVITGGVVTGSTQVTGKVGERLTITSDLQ